MIVTVSGYRSRTALSTSNPSPSSRRRSVSTRSYSTSRTIARAVAPLVVVATLYPSSCRIALIVTTTLSSSSTTRTLSCSGIARRSLDRQRDHERRPATHSAAHSHRPPVTLHDALRHPEPQPGPFPGLRGEERLEDLRDELVRYPLAGVTYLDLDGIPSEDLRLAAGTRLCGDRDCAALWHRVGRVEQEIEEDLLQLVGRCANAREPRIELGRDLNPALAEPFQHKTGGLLCQRVEIGLAHRLLLAVKTQHLPEDPRHALCLARRDVEVLAIVGVGAELLLQQVQSVLHGLKRIVDLVRDRRGQPAGRRELFRVEQDLLETPPLELAEATVVLPNRDDCHYRATPVFDLGRAHFHLEMFVGPGIGQPDLAPLRHRRLDPKTGEERRERRIVRQRRECRSRRRAARLEDPP